MTGAGALAFLLPALPICLWVAWSDMRAMRIPNLAVLALLAVFLVVAPFVLPMPDLLWRLAQGVIVLALGFVLSVAGVMGAGDAKFAAVMALFIAQRDIGMFCYLLAAVVLAAFATHRAMRRIEAVRRLAPDWESWERRDFPMGFALGGALLLYLAAGVAFGG